MRFDLDEFLNGLIWTVAMMLCIAAFIGIPLFMLAAAYVNLGTWGAVAAGVAMTIPVGVGLYFGFGGRRHD